MWHINTKISTSQTSAKGSVSSHFVTSCLPGEIFTRHCASTVKHGIFNTHIRISRFLVRTSFEDHIKIPPSQIRDPKSPVGSLRENFLVCRTCPLNMPLCCSACRSNATTHRTRSKTKIGICASRCWEGWLPSTGANSHPSQGAWPSAFVAWINIMMTDTLNYYCYHYFLVKYYHIQCV